MGENGARSGAREIAGFVLLALIWGSTWLVIKDQLGTVPPQWSVAWRFLVAALGMFALATLRGERLLLPRGTMAFAALVGLIQFAGNFQFVYQSERYITSGLVAVLFALLLVPNAVFARIFVGVPLERRFLAGSAVALVGISLLVLHEYRAAPASESVLLGIGLIGAALLCASTANVLLATERANRESAVVLLAWGMAWGTLGNVVWASLVAGPPAIDWSPRYLGGVLYLALVGTVLTFPIYLALIRSWGPGKAAYNGVAVPVVAMALSTLFEGYRWSTLAAAGAGVAMIGLLIALSGRKTSG